MKLESMEYMVVLISKMLSYRDKSIEIIINGYAAAFQIKAGYIHNHIPMKLSTEFKLVFI